MKKVIDGVVYDSEVAERICDMHAAAAIVVGTDSIPVNVVRTLMRAMTPKSGVLPHEVFERHEFSSGGGSYFTVNSSKMTSADGRYFIMTAVGNGYYSGHDVGITPVSATVARKFAETNADYDTYVKHFPVASGFDRDEARKIAETVANASKASEGNGGEE